MYFPDYSITNTTLKNVSLIEYAKAVIENTLILDNWQSQLAKKSQIDNTIALLNIENYNFPEEMIKKRIDGLTDKSHIEIENLLKASEYLLQSIVREELDVETIKEVHKILSEKINQDGGYFRTTYEDDKAPAAEILAKLYDLLDWYYSKDANDTHPVIASLLFLHEFLYIMPFKKFSTSIGILLFESLLSTNSYNIAKFVKLAPYLVKALKSKELDKFLKQDMLDDWLDYGTQIVASAGYKVKDEIQLLAKDTKIAKASGFVKLTSRQKRIVEYLQDYGLLRNSDFAKLFPDISEDSVLRDLKALIAEEIVIKSGSTKSSRYVLK